MQALLAYCESRRNWLIDTTAALVALESPSTHKAAVDRCGHDLARRLEAGGGRVEVWPEDTAGDHVVARFGDGDRSVLVLGHFDTVWPEGELARQPWRVEHGFAYGPGVYDMKAGLAMAMLAVQALVASPTGLPGRVTLLFTSDEEIGSGSSRARIETEARRSEAVLVLEPSLPGGALKTARKGCGEYVVRTRGVAAHAGVEPEKGASAVHELTRLVAGILPWQDLSRGLTVNVGTIRGGTRTNVVAASAEATVDVRVATREDGARIDGLMRGLRSRDLRVSVDVQGGIDRLPLERSASVVRLFDLARSLAGQIGIELGEGSTGGGSDGNFTAALGVPTIDGLGAIGHGAHALGECVDVAALPWRTALVAGLLRRVLER